MKMADKKKKKNITDERIEDNTMYGEFVPSFHQWMTMDRQRSIARHHEEVTDPDAPNHDDKRSD